jgi:hypothetical protein
MTASLAASSSLNSGSGLMKSLTVIAMLLTSANAFACDLSLVAPAKSVLKKPVQVKAVLADDMLTVSYAVTAPLNARKVLGPKQFPYMFDVVELFVTFSETGFPYFEFEVSPFNQTFQVRIPGGGKPLQEGVDLGLVSSATVVPHGWTAELKIPLKPLGWDGDPSKIRGNVYSILERAAKLLEFIPAQGAESELSSAAVFSAAASM